MTTNNNPACTRVLISYFTDGRVISEELSADDLVVHQGNVAAMILEDACFSDSDLLDIIHVASYVLKSRNNVN